MPCDPKGWPTRLRVHAAAVQAPSGERESRPMRQLPGEAMRGGRGSGLLHLYYNRGVDSRRTPPAVLEVARRSTEPRLGEGLVAFAEERARRRGCRELAARIDGADAELRAVLVARGFHPADVLVAGLVPAV